MILTTVCLGLSYKLCLYKFLDLFLQRFHRVASQTRYTITVLMVITMRKLDIEWKSRRCLKGIQID